MLDARIFSFSHTRPFSQSCLTLYHTIPTFNHHPPINSSFENIVVKGENAGNQSFLLFLQCFLPSHKQFSIFNIHLQILWTWTSPKFCHWYLVKLLTWSWVVKDNPLPNKPLFLRVCSTSLLKTLWEKEKLLVTSNFSFSHSVFKRLASYQQFFLFPLYFLPVWRTSCHLHPVWNSHLQTLSVWKSLKFVVW